MSAKRNRNASGTGDAKERTTLVARESLPSSHLQQFELVALWDGSREKLTLSAGTRHTIGRDLINHKSVSRRHAILEVGESVVWEDLGSTNGTYVHGRELARGERVSVQWNEPVQLGAVVVIVRRLRDEDPRATSAPVLEDVSDFEQTVQLAGSSNVPVLLLGETGVGKSYFAKRIHDLSRRASSEFMQINCASLPETLIESELFGHERGAFSGADKVKRGLFELAHGGTIFLDEVGEMPASSQAKLLMAIENRKIRPLGGHTERTIDVRFISATNRDISGRASGFRSDLYHRISVLCLTIPPLRQRLNEIEGLSLGFLRAYAIENPGAVRRLEREAVEVLSRYDWPGNIRELSNVIQRAALFGRSSAALTADQIRRALPPVKTMNRRHDDQPDEPLKTLLIRSGEPSGAPSEGDERKRIVAMLSQCAGNQSRAAKMLGMARRTLIARLEKYGLERPRKKT